MRILKTLALVTIITASAHAALAADAPAAASTHTKIAVVNIQGILRDSTAAKSARQQLESKQKAYQAELTKKEDALKKEEQELSKQQGVLAKDAFESKVSAFRSKATEAQKDVAGKKATLDNAFERAISDIQKAVQDIIADLAKEKGYVVALPTSQILYADKSLDISDEVLKRLNQKLPNLTVKFDAPAAAAPAKKDEKK